MPVMPDPEPGDGQGMALERGASSPGDGIMRVRRGGGGWRLGGVRVRLGASRKGCDSLSFIIITGPAGCGGSSKCPCLRWPGGGSGR